MSEGFLRRLQEMTQHLLTLNKSPSQFKILFHLFSMGRSLKAEEIANDLKITRKAVERALARLYEKGLVRRSSFRRGAYYCDLRSFTLCILFFCSDLHAQYLKEREVLV